MDYCQYPSLNRYITEQSDLFDTLFKKLDGAQCIAVVALLVDVYELGVRDTLSLVTMLREIDGGR